MREQLFDLLSQPGDPLLGVFNGVDVVLQHDLLGGGPSLTAAARDGRSIVRAGTEECLRRGRTEKYHEIGGQYPIYPIA